MLVIVPPPMALSAADFPIIRDEFLNLDFSSTSRLRAFSQHPMMRDLTAEHFEPMLEYLLRIREEFSWVPSQKTEAERAALRKYIGYYLSHAVSAFCCTVFPPNQADEKPILV